MSKFLDKSGKSTEATPQQNARPESRGERRLVSPFRCRVWTQHTRPDEQLTDHSCKSLLEAIGKNGQHQPTLGRPVRHDPDYDIEIICGARRHFVARALGIQLIVEVRELSDAEAYVAMYEENLLREGDCPYVRGLTILRAIRSGTLPTQEAAASAFNLSPSAVSRLLMVAQLPAIVIGAFQRPADIREGWAVELYRLWNDKDGRRLITAQARALGQRAARPSAQEIYEILATATGGKIKKYRPYRNVPVKGASGAVLFHEQDQLAKVTYIISKTILSPKRREILKDCIIKTLETEDLRNSRFNGSQREIPDSHDFS